MNRMKEDIEKCLRTLQAGGLILYPTDTIWGIGCDATNAAAVNKVYRVKRRDDHKSLIILLANEKDILRYVPDPPPGILDFLKTATRPTTVIYEKTFGLPANLINPDGSIAIRIVKDAFCQALIERLGKPVVSTSANISGEASPRNFKEINPILLEQVDYTVYYRQNDSGEQAASRIVKMHADGSFQVIRP